MGRWGAQSTLADPIKVEKFLNFSKFIKSFSPTTQ